MKTREEYFTAFKDGKEECLCRFILPDVQGSSLKELFDEIYCRLKNACETGDLIRKYEKSAEKRESFSVTPYRYICRCTPCRVCDGILSFKIESSLDARFPGGVHLSRTYGFLYDEKGELIICSEAVLPMKERRKIRKKGRVCSSYADEEGIHLLFIDGNESIFPTESFLSTVAWKSICKRKAKKRKRY